MKRKLAKIFHRVGVLFALITLVISGVGLAFITVPLSIWNAIIPVAIAIACYVFIRFIGWVVNGFVKEGDN